MIKTLSIIIPVYNESDTLTDLLDRVLHVALPVKREIIVVNDGSTDDSRQLAEDWFAALNVEQQADVFLLDKANGGKGSAVRAGIEQSNGDVVIIQDADLEYDPNDYEACIAPILNGEELVVYGSRERFARNRLHSSFAFYAGGLAVTYWMNLLYGSSMTDEPTCYKTFSGRLIRALLFRGDKFEWEPEVTAKLLRLGVHIHEVPISYAPRKVDEGKKINWKDGVQALAVALYWRFMPLDAERKKVAAVPGMAECLAASRWPWAIMIVAMCAVARLSPPSLAAGIAWSSAVPAAMHLACVRRSMLCAILAAGWVVGIPLWHGGAFAISATAMLWSVLWLTRFAQKRRVFDLALAATSIAGLACTLPWSQAQLQATVALIALPLLLAVVPDRPDTTAS